MIETRSLEKPQIVCHPERSTVGAESKDPGLQGPVDFKSLANFDILAFTSTNGVECFFKQLFAAGYDVRVLSGKKIAGVGKITEKKLLEYGIRCDYVPEDHTGEGLGLLLRDVVDKCEHVILSEERSSESKDLVESRILLLQGNLADDTLLKLLPKATRWTVYETLPVAELPEWKCEAIASADAIVFASSSAVENFSSVIPAKAGISFDHCPHTSFCIGRMTEASAKKHGFETVTSDETTMDSLVKKIVEYYTMGENA